MRVYLHAIEIVFKLGDCTANLMLNLPCFTFPSQKVGQHKHVIMCIELIELSLPTLRITAVRFPDLKFLNFKGLEKKNRNQSQFFA